jgi:Domain of unknown function (DUF4258)
MTAQDIKNLIQARVRSKQYRLSGHAESEREADQITHQEIVDALLSEQCEIIEDYANDPRGASCLALGFTRESKPIHIVCGISLADVMVVITVYRPDPDEWIAWRKRKEN